MQPVNDGSSRPAIPRIAGFTCVALGAFVLVGWVLGISWIKSVLPGAVTMKANTALGLLLSGAALWLLDPAGAPRSIRLGQVLAAIVAALGIGTAGEYLFGWQLHIDELLFRDTADAYNAFRGRMSPYSALVFATIGLGLAALPSRSLRWLVRLAAIVTLLVGVVSFIGYLWNASELVTDRILPPVAVHTAAAFALLGFGTIMSTRTPSASARRQELSVVERKSLTGFVATLVLLLLAGGITYRANVAATESARMVAHTQQVRASLSRLYGAVSDAESQQRNYLLSAGPAYLDDYKAHFTRAEDEAAKLAGLVADNPAQSERLRQLQATVHDRIALLGRTVAIFDQSGLAAAQEAVRRGEGRKLMSDIRSMIARMDAAEMELLAVREVRTSRNNATTLLSLLGTLFFALGGFFVLFRGIRREMATRALAETALRRSEENLRVTLDSIGDAVLATDTRGCITRMNPVAEALTGWTQTEALGRPIAEVFRIVNEETREPAAIPVERVLATGQVQGLANHTALIARDGTERPIADSAAPIQDRTGSVLGVVLVFRDVTAEKAAAAALNYERYLLRALMDNMPADIYFKDVESRFVRNNRAHAHRLGLADPAEAVGKSDRDFFSDEHASEAIADERQVMRTGEIVSKEEKETWPDGRVTWVLTVKVPLLDEHGNVSGTFGISQDITKRKLAEQELERFFSLSLDFLCIASDDGYFKRVSAAVTDILGWTVEEFLATPYLELVHPDDRESTAREVERQIIAGQKTMHFENRYRCRDGGWRLLSWRSVPFGRLMYATARDVTELRRREEQIAQLNADLQQKARLLEEANRELEAFSYSVSHDLRAPLRHVSGYVEMLARESEGRLTEKGERYLRTITAASTEMANLIDELLAFSRMGRTEMRTKSVDLNRLVQTTLTGLEMATRERNIVWNIAPLPTATGDPAMLHQVFANLLGNAVKYTRPRDPAVIDVGCAGEEEGRLIFFVRDNGAGFDMQYAGKLFGVFQRLHRADEFEGTGIGLANVRRIISRHGGRTWAEGKVGAGATFYFTLAAAPATDSPTSVSTEISS